MALSGKKVIHGNSIVPGRVPLSEQIGNGQLFINSADELLFIKNSSGDVVQPKPRSMPLTVTGDVSGSGTTSAVNVTLPSIVSAGTYKSVTVNAKGP
jgi:hypothetical protein